MLLLSLGLHMTAVFFFAGLPAPRLPELPRPVCYVDLIKQPVVPQAGPPEIPAEQKRETAPSHPEPAPQLIEKPASRGPVAPTAKEVPPPPPELSRKAVEAPISAPKVDRPAPGDARAVGIGLDEVEIGPGISRRLREERLPTAEKIAFARPGEADPLPPSPDAGRERYGSRFPDPALPQTPRDSSLHHRAVEPDLSAAAIASRRFRETSAIAPQQAAGRRTAAIGEPAAPDVALPPPAAASPVKAAAAAPRLSGAKVSFDFLDRVAPADLDRMHLVSLNRLRTCLDPEAEMNLRTRLATLLSRPATCRTGGVVFDIRQPESAWSIHIDIYNYEKREFEDRCAALQMAVASCEGARR